MSQKSTEWDSVYTAQIGEDTEQKKGGITKKSSKPEGLMAIFLT